MHISTLISFSRVVLAGVVAAAGVPRALAPSDDMKGGFMKDCWWTGEFIPRGEMYGSYTAQSPPSNASPNDGKDWHTSLNLNGCLINHDGKMLWQANGNAFQSCVDCNSERGQANIIACQRNSGGPNPKNVLNKIDLSE